MAPRAPKEVPRRPQEASRWQQDGPKTAPRRPQDGSKSLPSRIPKQLHVSLSPASPKMSPRSPRDPPREPPEATQEVPKSSKQAPRGPQEARKMPPRGSQEAPTSPIFTIKVSISCGRGSIFLSYTVACNMSPLGRRRGPALRAESGGGRREVRPKAARCVRPR